MYPRPAPSSDPYTNGGYGSEWEDGSAYTPSSEYPSRVESPYSSMPLPYGTPRDNTVFYPMLGMASHLVPPPRSHPPTSVTPTTSLSQGFMGSDTAFLELTPGEPLFGGSPTPSADEPITPVDDCHAWEQDTTMGIDVLDDMSPFGGAM